MEKFASFVSKLSQKNKKKKNNEFKTQWNKNLRNRIFHHESVTWNLSALIVYKKEIIEGIDWLDKDLLIWCNDIFRIDNVIEDRKYLIE